MANGYRDLPVTGGAGVSSLNGQTGALTLVAGTGITITPGAGTLTIDATGGFGVTSVNTLTGALTLVTGTGGSDFNVGSAGTVLTLNLPVASASNTGKLSNTDWTTFNNKVPTSRTISTTSPLTGGGDLSANRTISFLNQTANTVLSGPTSGGAAAPAFRALVAADIPSLTGTYATVTLNNLTAGSVAIPNGADLVPANAFGFSVGTVLKPVNKIFADGFYGASNTLKVFDAYSITMNDNLGVLAANFQSRSLLDSAGNESITWTSRRLKSNDTSTAVEWPDNDTLYIYKNLLISPDGLTGSIAGGVGSYANEIRGYFPGGEATIPDSGSMSHTIIAWGDGTGLFEITGTDYHSGFIKGYTDTSGQLKINNANGGTIFGHAVNGSHQRVTADDGMIHAFTDGPSNYAEAAGVNSKVEAYIQNATGSSYASANSNLAWVRGIVTGSNSYILATGDNSFNHSTITADNSYSNAGAESTFANFYIGASNSYGQVTGTAAFGGGYITGSNSRISVQGTAGWGWAYQEAGDEIFEVNNTGFGIARMSGGQGYMESEAGFLMLSTDASSDSVARTSSEAGAAFFKMDGTGSLIELGGNGNAMFVQVDSASAVQSTDGGLVHGKITSGASLSVNGVGSRFGGSIEGTDTYVNIQDTSEVFVRATSGATASATSYGSYVRGDIVGALSELTAEAEVCTTIGRIVNAGSKIKSTGTMTWSWGDDTYGDVLTSGNRGTSWGSDIDNSGVDSHLWGYGLTNSNSDVFLVGFGSEMFKTSTADGVEVKADKFGLSDTVANKATLVAGTVTVSHPNIQSTDIIIVTVQTAGGTQGFLSIANIVADTSFDIVSSSALDTSEVGYIVIKK